MLLFHIFPYHSSSSFSSPFLLHRLILIFLFLYPLICLLLLLLHHLLYFILLPPPLLLLLLLLFTSCHRGFPWCYFAWSWELPSDRNILPCLHRGVLIPRDYHLIIPVVLTIIIHSAFLLVIETISKLSRRSELSSGTPCKVVINHGTIHLFFLYWIRRTSE